MLTSDEQFRIVRLMRAGLRPVLLPRANKRWVWEVEDAGGQRLQDYWERHPHPRTVRHLVELGILVEAARVDGSKVYQPGPEFPHGKEQHDGREGAG